MNIDRKYKPELLCSDDETRAVLMNLNVRKDGPHQGTPVMEATNGRAYVSVPVEVDDGDELGQVPQKVLKRSRADTPRCTDEVIILMGKDEFLSPPEGVKYKRLEVVGKFPNTKQVFLPEGGKVHSVTFNPYLLADIASAMAVTDGVTLEFIDDVTIIKVVPCSIDKSRPSPVGLLMPMRKC